MDIEIEEYWRLEALCEHYDIDIGKPDAMYRLAMSLARVHVPGFKHEPIEVPTTRRRGQPRQLSHVERLKLQNAVRRLVGKRDPKTGKEPKITNAIYEVASKSPFDKYELETVRRTYYRDANLPNPIVSIYQDQRNETKELIERFSPPKYINGAFGVYSARIINRPKKSVRKSK